MRVSSSHVRSCSAHGSQLSGRLEGPVTQSLSLLDRALSAIAGLSIGAVLGMLGLYFLMTIVGSDFGLDNVRSGAVLGAVLGVLLGLRRPWHWTWLDLVD